MSGGLTSSGARVVPGLSPFGLIVDLLVGVVIFVVVVVVAAVLMALLQAVLPGGSGDEAPQDGRGGGSDAEGDAPASRPNPPAEVGGHPADTDVRELDTPGSGG